MHSYSIYTGIAHINQLLRLQPDLITRIKKDLDEIVTRHGGRSVDSEWYTFPSTLGETIRKTAEAGQAIYTYLREYKRELLGITVFITDETIYHQKIKSAGMMKSLLTIPDDNGFWLASAILKDFEKYLDGDMEDGLFRVFRMKEAGPRLEERLPQLLIRSERLPIVRHALETLERDENDRSVLLIRGEAGSGKRSTLKRALKDLYPDDGGAPLILPFSSDSEDPMEPFVRVIGPPLATVSEYLDEKELEWWNSEGLALLESSKQGKIWDTSRDQGPVDLIQAFALYVKAYVEHRRQHRRPAYLLVDDFAPSSESVSWLRSLLNEFLGQESFRLIIIRDSGNFEERLPLPGRGHEVAFREPSEDEWTSIVDRAALGSSPNINMPALLKICGANMYRLFHFLLAWERNLNSAGNPTAILVRSLDNQTRRTLFLAHAASGLIRRGLLTERFGEDEDKRVQEEIRYNGLIDFGLIREDPDGRIRGLGDEDTWAAIEDIENIREAEIFGEYLVQRQSAGEAMDLFRLFRYLERWGPAVRAVAVLDRLLDRLLTNRRLRATGILLKELPMSLIDLEGPDMEALQNVVGAARLRFVLLTGDIHQVRNLARDGTVSFISGRGAYSHRFQLHIARFSYVVGRWDESLAASKEALFTFQQSGEHEGATLSHIELALALLALGKVRDALEHFGIARRIGIQINASWGVLRASALGTITQFLFGNLSHAMRECRQYRSHCHQERRRDLWLLLTLVGVRISWELGRYRDVVTWAKEGEETSRFYSMPDEQRVMSIWKGRGLLAGGEEEGRHLLREAAVTDAPGAREALAFLAEDAWFDGKTAAARDLLTMAALEKRKSTRLQGETEDWSDGFYPIEGRLADSSGPLDVLGEWIEAFSAYLAAQDGEDGQIDRLTALFEKGGRRVASPYSYQYALWATLITPENEMELQTRYMSRAFDDLQYKAGRFDDNQMKHAWLTANPWNKGLMDEAQKRKLL